MRHVRWNRTNSGSIIKIDKNHVQVSECFCLFLFNCFVLWFVCVLILQTGSPYLDTLVTAERAKVNSMYIQYVYTYLEPVNIHVSLVAILLIELLWAATSPVGGGGHRSMISHTHSVRYVPIAVQESGCQSFSNPPLHPLSIRGDIGDPNTPRALIALPWGWAPSTACTHHTMALKYTLVITLINWNASIKHCRPLRQRKLQCLNYHSSC